MIQAHEAIVRLRRDLAISAALKYVLVALAVFAIFVQTLEQTPVIGSVALALVGTVALVLTARSMKGSRLAAVSPALIAAGRFEQAEAHIAEALKSFSMFRNVKLRSLHHLAMLRHAQRRFGETAMLCQALLGERLGPLNALSRSARLILADSLLEVGDVYGAYGALAELYRERLSLGEAVQLTAIQLDYLARVGARGETMQGVEKKIELLELAPTKTSARGQAMLALAAKRMGMREWERYLRRRVELVAEPAELIKQRPVLAEVWGQNDQCAMTNDQRMNKPR
jgi:hypothetical protein